MKTEDESANGKLTEPFDELASETARGDGEGVAHEREGKASARKLRRLEKRLAKARDDEQKRARQLARATGKRQKVEAAIAALGDATPAPADVVEPPAAPAPETSGPGIEAYCVREHRRVTPTTQRSVTLGNGRTAISGPCPSCGATVYRIVAASSARAGEA